jgi:hypothetical protein
MWWPRPSGSRGHSLMLHSSQGVKTRGSIADAHQTHPVKNLRIWLSVVVQVSGGWGRSILSLRSAWATCEIFIKTKQKQSKHSPHQTLMHLSSLVTLWQCPSEFPEEKKLHRYCLEAGEQPKSTGIVNTISPQCSTRLRLLTEMTFRWQQHSIALGALSSKPELKLSC